ncbi:MAG: alpha/beta fold hydrolase [Gemmatimonadetes bacterium]|nr:alpha/beta fold hydrolase [Gemmatimonadota bacterium]
MLLSLRRAVWFVLLIVASCIARPAQAAGGAFVMTALRDTIAVERYERTGDRLEGVLLFKLARLRFDYTLGFGAQGEVVRMTNAVRPASAALATAPTQSATLEWRGDSVHVEVQPGKPEHLATQRGSVPYLNPSMALLELIVQQARRADPPKPGVPVFAVAGGRTFEMQVEFPSSDSARVKIGAVEFLLRIDREARLLSGSVPTQSVEFTRAESLPEGLLSIAPQDYSAPVGAPYTTESVKIPTRAGHTLAGTLAWPTRPGKQPAVLLVSGSGPQDRDESIALVPGFRPFRQIADTLARRGIAVLRLDDRGVGESGGVFGTATTQDFADDAEDAMRWLKTLHDIDSTRVAIVGHSEGGIIAPMVAARGTRLAAMALMAGPAWTGRRIVHEQNRYAATKSLSGAVLDSVMRSADAAVDSIGREQRWYGFFLAHDPLAVARQLRTPPVLLLQGETDRQVTPGQADELAAAFKQAGNKDVTVKKLAATNHLFLSDPSGDPQGYTALQKRALEPGTLGVLADWLAVRLKVATTKR